MLSVGDGRGVVGTPMQLDLGSDQEDSRHAHCQLSLGASCKRMSGWLPWALKARLVVASINKGQEFDLIYNLVVKTSTMCTILAISGMKNWLLHHIDVYYTFPNRKLHETVFTRQTLSFHGLKWPQHICELYRVLYGLKQIPCVWYQHLLDFVLQCGFSNSTEDVSLFVRHIHGKIVHILIYFDDFIITGIDDKEFAIMIANIYQTVQICNHGNLSYFLSLEMNKLSDRTMITQKKYSINLLGQFGLSDCKPISTPVLMQCWL